MEVEKKTAIFVSYCHKDEEEYKYKSSFLTHIKPLESQGKVKIWCDENIRAGEKLSTIDDNLSKSDIVCLLLSANFIASTPCNEELKKAIFLKKTIIPIVLSACSWKDIPEIKDIRVIPHDGRPINSFERSDEAWQDVYTKIKDVVSSNVVNEKIFDNSPEFKEFLNDVGLLTKTSPHKEKLNLEDIFVFPEIEEYLNEEEKTEKYCGDKLKDLILSKKRVLISGDTQSGKSSLLKVLYSELRLQGFIPIWISAKENELSGFLERQLEKLYHEQYTDLTPFSNLDYHKIIPIIDDFHLYVGKNKKEKIIFNLNKYSFSILTVDDIFVLNFKDTELLSSYVRVRILPFKPSKKVELITKWVDLDDSFRDDNSRLQRIDEAEAIVNTTLGNEFHNGIMPSYPFFILSVLGAYYTGQPLQDITSQGYCYFFIILMNLDKNGVSRKLVDGYLNFLTNLAFEFFELNKSDFHEEQFSSFITKYSEKYNLPSDINKMKEILIKSNILCHDSIGRYYFKFKYIYYYFVAKFLAEHFESKKELINNLIANLHRNDYAYIIIFLTHHMRNQELFDEILLNALTLLDQKKEASLTKKELVFFDNKLEDMVFKLPSKFITPEEARKKELLIKDETVQISTIEQDDSIEDSFSLELRRSLKTVEVIGQIIKNRSGSLNKESLNSLFESGLNICFRIISYCFDFLKDKQNEDFFIKIIVKKLEKDQDHKIQDNKKFAEKFFWSFNFALICALLEIAISYLGTEQAIPNIMQVTNKINTPASLLVKHGMLMRYKRDLNSDEIKLLIEKGNWHYIPRNIMKLMVIRYSVIYDIKENIKQISSLFKISPNMILAEQIKRSNS